MRAWKRWKRWKACITCYVPSAVCGIITRRRRRWSYKGLRLVPKWPFFRYLLGPFSVLCIFWLLSSFPLFTLVYMFIHTRHIHIHWHNFFKQGPSIQNTHIISLAKHLPYTVSDGTSQKNGRQGAEPQTATEQMRQKGVDCPKRCRPST